MDISVNSSKGTLYVVHNLINGKMYIGKTVGPLNERWNRHLYDARHGSREYFHRAIQKYGEDAFLLLPLCTKEDPADLARAEVDLIAAFQTNDREHGYNLTAGGEGWPGRRHSSESKQRMRAVKLGKTASEGTRWKMRLAQRGRHHTEETKQKMSAAALGRKFSAEARKNMSRAKRRAFCKQGHPLSGDNVYVSPSSGRRKCKECNRRLDRERLAKLRLGNVSG